MPCFEREDRIWLCTIIFLGMLLDGDELCLAISEEKRNKARHQLNNIINKRTTTVKDLQSLTGLLNFLTKAIVPGRAFTRRLFTKIPAYIYGLQQRRIKLKFFHHVTVDREFRSDCQMWLSFLDYSQRDKRVLCHPFIDFEKTQVTSRELNFYTDASAKETLGFGALYQNQCTFGIWEKDFVKTMKPSIEYLELYAVCIGIFCWGHQLKNVRVTIFCDNQAVVQMINNTISSCKNCMYLIRMLDLDGIKYNRRLFAKYVKIYENDLADALSRQQFTRFWKLAPRSMNKFPT